MKTAVSANCQLCPMPKQTEKAKKAFKPIPRGKGQTVTGQEMP